jgi:hypothetical protein
MARPKNLTVLNGNTVFSLSPSKFKEYLAAKAAGTTLPGLGKALGTIAADVGVMTPPEAEALLATLTPAPTTTAEVATTPAPAADPAVATA